MLVWREGLHSRLPTAFYPLRISSRQPAIRSTRQADAMRLILRILTSRISNKIILPYLLLALFLATAMTFVAVRLTTGALQDRAGVNQRIETFFGHQSPDSEHAQVPASLRCGYLFAE